MEDYLKATIFSFDLVEDNLMEWEADPLIYDDEPIWLTTGIESPFHDAIGEAVSAIQKFHMAKLRVIINSVRERFSSHKTNSQFFLEDAIPYFKDGYRHESFIFYCAIVTGIASYYNNLTGTKIAHNAIHSISCVLTGFILTGEFQQHGGWDGLSGTARKILDSWRQCDLYNVYSKDFKQKMES